MHVGDHLRALRERRKLSQEKAAGLAGLTRNTIAGLEAKQFPNPHLNVLLALMDVYDVGSIEELLGWMPSRRVSDHWSADGWSGTRFAPHEGPN